MNLQRLEIDNIKNKKVLLRLDLDVKTQEQKVVDEFRLIAGIETLKFLLENASHVIVLGHRGRPSSEKTIDEQSKLSIEPVALWFKEKLGLSLLRKETRGDFISFVLSEKLSFLENLRFYKGERENDPVFTEKLASLGEVFVNDAFSVSHREEASTVGVARILPHYPGFNLLKEIEVLSKVLENPERPLVAILGGTKLETKLPLVLKMKDLANYVLVGGELATKKEELQSKLENDEKVKIAELNLEKTDLTKEAIEEFSSIIRQAKTIIWNGALGIFEKKESRMGTEEIAKLILNSKAYSVVGGGDTISFLNEEGIIDKFSFVSTGGGAMIEFLSGKKLPAIDILA